MNLWDRVLGELNRGVRRLAVAGMAKNTGKTTVLNHLIRRCLDRPEPPVLGLISTGRDGEKLDAVTQLPKPSIWAPEGTLIATARPALEPGTGLKGTAEADIIEEIAGAAGPLSTIFGPLVIGRVRTSGTVLLVGPGPAAAVGRALGRLEAHGAGLCLADGSLSRLACAAPEITHGVILATGAALSPDPAAVIRLTRYQAEVFTAPRLPDSPIRDAAAAAPGAVAALDAGGTLASPRFSPRLLAADTAVGLGARLLEEARDARILVFRGALPASFLAAANLRPEVTRQLHLVVPDPTHIFADPLVWRRFARLGGRVWVLSPVNLIAVTLNPWSPAGQGFDPGDFLARARAGLAPVPVHDVCLEDTGG